MKGPGWGSSIRQKEGVSTRSGVMRGEKGEEVCRLADTQICAR